MAPRELKDFDGDPDPLEDDEEIRVELFRTLRYQGIAPESLRNTVFAADYATWLEHALPDDE